MIAYLSYDVVHFGGQLLDGAPETVTDSLLATRPSPASPRGIVLAAPSSSLGTLYGASPGSVLVVQLSLLVELVEVFQGLMLRGRFEGVGALGS